MGGWLSVARAGVGSRSVVALAALVLCLAGSASSAAALELGVNVHPEQPVVNFTGSYDAASYGRVLDLMQGAGARIVRVPIPWAWLEPAAKGQYDRAYLDKVDAFMAAAKARGLAVLATTGGPPCWATSYPNATCGPGYLSTPGAAYPPRDLADAGDDAAFIASRWGAYLAGIEVLNEPDAGDYFQVPPGTDRALAYTNIVGAEYAGVKRVAPALPVIAGALASADSAFLQSLYNDGVAAHSDAISIHPYNIRWDDPFVSWGDPAVPWPDASTQSFALGVPQVHGVMVANGDAAKPLWLTELGFSACNPSYLCLDETTQAQYLQDSLALARSWPYVQVALVHEAWDSSPNREAWNGFGLLRNDFSRRPAYCTFAQQAGVSGCQPDALPSELAAQDDLTRAWQLGRAYYLSHGRSFAGFDAIALHAADTSFSGYDLTLADVTPGPAADPRRVGVWVNAGANAGSELELCNSSATLAYCILERTGAADGTPGVAHGEAPGGVWQAAGATKNATSTDWSPPATTGNQPPATSPAPATTPLGAIQPGPSPPPTQVPRTPTPAPTKPNRPATRRSVTPRHVSAHRQRRHRQSNARPRHRRRRSRSRARL